MSENFSIRLKKIRESRNLSQTDLALRSGFQPSAISHFETGRRQPSLDNLKKLADTLNVTIDFLLGRVELPGISGPVAEQLFMNFANISTEDQKILSDFVTLLANRNKEKHST